jgi:hypothetical protein
MVPHPLDAREHAQKTLLYWHSCAGYVSVLARVPGIIILAQEASLGLLCHHRRQLDLVIGKLRLGNDVADAPHHEEAASDRGIKEMLDVVTVPQVASVAIANALGGSDIRLVAIALGGLGHRELVHSGDVPEVVVHAASLGIHERVAEVVGRGQEHVPLGSAEELLVTREVSGVSLFASGKIKIRDVVRDDVGGVGEGHCCLVLSALGGCFNW